MKLDWVRNEITRMRGQIRVQQRMLVQRRSGGRAALVEPMPWGKSQGAASNEREGGGHTRRRKPARDGCDSFLLAQFAVSGDGAADADHRGAFARGRRRSCSRLCRRYGVPRRVRDHIETFAGGVRGPIYGLGHWRCAMWRMSNTEVVILLGWNAGAGTRLGYIA